ncbi:IucA/IucC family protein, partial [Paenibacillus sepulcri]|nr:IucA/IucC family protein [Paenibacillus sepulcri]
ADSGVRLVPMSALAARMTGADRHFFDVWMKVRGLEANEASVRKLFGEVCDAFFDINLRLYRIGLLPEIHGQNSVLVWKDGRIEGMLLRDHDSVRLHLPWLAAQGIGDPEYRIRPGYSNSLYNETPEKLLFYMQTLGIQVNLYSIIDMLSAIYSVEERALWHTLQESLKAAIRSLPFQEEVRLQMEEILFARHDWPLKLIVKPLLEQEGVPGSMPSGKGIVQNPFHHLDKSAPLLYNENNSR